METSKVNNALWKKWCISPNVKKLSWGMCYKNYWKKTGWNADKIYFLNLPAYLRIINLTLCDVSWTVDDWNEKCWYRENLIPI